MKKRSLNRTLFRISELERGSALIEFVLVSVVLLIPLLYLVLAMGQIQRASFAADEAASTIARSLSITENWRAANNKTRAQLQLISADYGVEIQPTNVEVRCLSEDCSTSGALLQVQVDVAVGLPWLRYGPGIARVHSQMVIPRDPRSQTRGDYE